MKENTGERKGNPKNDPENDKEDGEDEKFAHGVIGGDEYRHPSFADHVPSPFRPRNTGDG